MATIKKIMGALLILVAIIALGVLLFLHTERLGKHPSGERLADIELSPNFEKGSFKNLNPTPMFTKGVGMGKVLYEFVFTSRPKEPGNSLPSVKTDLLALAADENVLVWMGHSSYFMQLDGKKILVDPVFSGNASPLSFTTKAFPGTDIYITEDIPEIDYLFLSHDHWDHMDYKTLKNLNPKVKKVITGLGNGSHLESWGYKPGKIIEGHWYDAIPLDHGFTAHITPTRHFSGRGLKRNQTLWASFVLQSPSLNIYIGGDSGYGTHFKEIGEKYGPFDLAVLENGQYDSKWKYIHMLPGEQFKAANDLDAHTIFPVHSGKFTLANHPWDEPLAQITDKAAGKNTRVITPKLGEEVSLKDTLQQFEPWWQSVE